MCGELAGSLSPIIIRGRLLISNFACKISHFSILGPPRQGSLRKSVIAGGAALRILSERGLVEFQKEDTARRAAECWFARNEDARKARKEREGEGE